MDNDICIGNPYFKQRTHIKRYIYNKMKKTNIRLTVFDLLLDGHRRASMSAYAGADEGSDHYFIRRYSYNESKLLATQIAEK